MAGSLASNVNHQPQFGITISFDPSQPETALLSMIGDFDANQVEHLHRAFDAIFDTPCRRLVVDMAGVTFIDCGNLRELSAASEQAMAIGAVFHIDGIKPFIRHLVRLFGLDASLGLPPSRRPSATAARSPHDEGATGHADWTSTG